MDPDASSDQMSFSVVGADQIVELVPDEVIVAGYTGRDRAAVQAHIDELEEIGVAPPPMVPMFYDVPVPLATSEARILVDGARTSGEVEPVIIGHGGRWYLGVGSDHTDRDIETRDIGESKASAPKPVGPRVIPLEAALEVWDDIEVECHVDDRLYQRATLKSLLRPTDLLDEMAERGRPPKGDVLMFGGTVPLEGGQFVYGSVYDLELRLPDGTALKHTYTVKRRDE